MKNIIQLIKNTALVAAITAIAPINAHAGLFNRDKTNDATSRIDYNATVPVVITVTDAKGNTTTQVVEQDVEVEYISPKDLQANVKLVVHSTGKPLSNGAGIPEKAERYDLQAPEFIGINLELTDFSAVNSPQIQETLAKARIAVSENRRDVAIELLDSLIGLAKPDTNPPIPVNIE